MDAKVNPLWICTNRGQITIESPEPCLQNMRVNVKNMTLKPLTGCFARDGRPIRLSTSPMLAKSPNRQAAVAYLAACNATAITIVDRDGIGVIIAKGTVRGQMVDRHSGCPAHGRAGRRCAGESPDMGDGHRGGAALSGLLSPSAASNSIGGNVGDAARLSIADVPRRQHLMQPLTVVALGIWTACRAKLPAWPQQLNS
jgi:hypothetical protein